DVAARVRPSEKFEVSDAPVDNRHQHSMDVTGNRDLRLRTHVSGGGDADESQVAGVAGRHVQYRADGVECQAPWWGCLAKLEKSRNHQRVRDMGHYHPGKAPRA